jgi:hypothetical protein
VEGKPEELNGKLMTNGPGDLFKILNEVFLTLDLCKSNELAIELVGACGNTMQYYLDGLDKCTKNMTLSADQYSAFCNNVITAMSLTKDYCETARLLTKLEEEQMDNYFDEAETKRKFTEIGRLSYEKIVAVNFKLMEELVMKPFLELNVESTLVKIFENIGDYIPKIHPSYQTKIWMGCIERTVLLYCKCLLNSADKKLLKKQDLAKCTAKLAKDHELIKDMYRDVIKANALENQLKNIANFEDFLKSSYEFLPSACQELKECYGNTLKWKTLKLLLDLREDIDQKNDVLKKCQEIIEAQVFETTKDEAKRSNLFKKLTLTEAAFREAEFTADRVSPTLGVDSGADQQSSTKKKVKTNLSNYLDFKESKEISGGSGGYDTKYFSIRNKNIYMYKNKNSDHAEFCYQVNTLVACETVETAEELEFLIIMKNCRYLKCKCSITEERDEWVAAINECIKFSEEDVSLDIDDVFYTDLTPLFEDFESDPDLNFNYIEYANRNKQVDEKKKQVQKQYKEQQEKEQKSKQLKEQEEQRKISIQPVSIKDNSSNSTPIIKLETTSNTTPTTSANTTITSNTDQLQPQIRRRTSFDLEDGPIEYAFHPPENQESCGGAICRVFSFGRRSTKN